MAEVERCQGDGGNESGVIEGWAAYSDDAAVRSYITWNPAQMNGQPCVRGMRLTVRRVVESVALYSSRDELFRNYPELEPEDVQQALHSRRRTSKTAPKKRTRRRSVPVPLKLMLDQGVPRDAAGRLRAIGYDCIHVGEAGLSAASDEEILRLAMEKAAVVVTLDADFHAILAVSGAPGPSVIRIRVQGLRGWETAECVGLVCTRFESELIAGSLVTVKKRKTTCHRLPIGRSPRSGGR